MQGLSLESFDAADDEASASDAAFEEGYAQGYSAGMAAAKDQHGALDAALVQAVTDIEFKYAEASSEITRSLAPFLATLVAQVLPHCVANGFADLIVTRLAQAVEDASFRQAAIVVHPAQRAAVEAAIAKSAATVAVSEDPRLGQHAAWIRHDDQEIHIDQDRILAEISAVLAAIDLPPTRKEPHG